MGGNKKKVKFSSNFPLSSSITYTRVELSTEGKKNTAVAIIAHFWGGGDDGRIGYFHLVVAAYPVLHF